MGCAITGRMTCNHVRDEYSGGLTSLALTGPYPSNMSGTEAFLSIRGMTEDKLAFQTCAEASFVVVCERSSLRHWGTYDKRRFGQECVLPHGTLQRRLSRTL
jgi:hypothetical protein